MCETRDGSVAAFLLINTSTAAEQDVKAPEAFCGGRNLKKKNLMDPKLQKKIKVSLTFETHFQQISNNAQRHLYCITS